MKRVVLIGDSIRLTGYGAAVQKRLSGDFDVWQSDENARYVQYTLRCVFDWEEQLRGADVIHWNNGLWDVSNLYGDGEFTPPQQYLSGILRLARLFSARARKVIFATTTPIWPGYRYKSNEDIDRYNALVVPPLKEMGVVINDLNAVLRADIQGCITETDGIHLSEKGIRLCADAVEDCIRKTAASID